MLSGYTPILFDSYTTLKSETAFIYSTFNGYRTYKYCPSKGIGIGERIYTQPIIGWTGNSVRPHICVNKYLDARSVRIPVSTFQVINILKTLRY